MDGRGFLGDSNSTSHASWNTDKSITDSDNKVMRREYC